MTVGAMRRRNLALTVMIVYLVAQFVVGVAWMGVSLGTGSSLWHQASGVAGIALITLVWAVSVRLSWPRWVYSNIGVSLVVTLGLVLLMVASLATLFVAVSIARGVVG